jgi:hypothetical protein
MKPWQVLLNKTPSNEGNKKQRKRTQVQTKSTKTQSGRSQRCKGTSYVLEPPPIIRNTFFKKGERTPEIVISLEKPSPKSRTCLKIELACFLQG